MAWQNLFTHSAGVGRCHAATASTMRQPCISNILGQSCLHYTDSSAGGPAVSPPSVPQSVINLQAATDARIASLQQQLAERAAQAAELQQQLAAAQQAIAARDAEVSRLGEMLGAGPDIDKLARDQLSAASENIILSLNKQVGEKSGMAPNSFANTTAPAAVCNLFCATAPYDWICSSGDLHSRVCLQQQGR